MPHSTTLILTLATAFAASLAFGLVTHRMRLSPIVGYLLAGVIVGPFTPGFVAHPELAQELAEIGVVLLMFGVGLHFHVKELLAVRKIAIPGALIQIAVATVLGTLLAEAFDWSRRGGLVLGLSISVASTVVLLRVLSDFGILHTRAGHIAVGWLVLEDLFTVLVLVLLPLLVADEPDPVALASSVAIALVKVSVLVALVFVAGRRLIPRLIEHVAATRSRELFTLTVLTIALGIAVGSALLFDVSFALGAFLAGMVVGQSEFSSRAASEALPMRDAFAVLFFVAMGMLFDPSRLMDQLWLTLGVLGLVVIIKPLTAFVTLRVMRYPVEGALAISFSLAQVGEFSFILTALGRQLEVLPEAGSQVLVIAALVSITLNPLLFRLQKPLARRSVRPQSEPSPAPEDGHAYRTIVVGYGPVGRIVTRVLRENALYPVVIELNHQTVNTLQREGQPAIYGDAAQQTILELAGIQHAVGLIFSAATPPEAVVRLARQLNPRIVVLARATYLDTVPELGSAGAQVVVTDEAEVAIAMAERLLVSLGATAEQVDRERARVRAELAPTSKQQSLRAS